MTIITLYFNFLHILIMKYIVSILLLMAMSLNSLFAGDEEYEKKEIPVPYSVVERFDGDFEVTLNDDNSVTASWDDFSGEGFDWYKLMYSTTNSAPVYPKDHVAFVGNASQTEASFKLKYGKNHYIRICAITVEENYRKGLYCSDVKKLEVDIQNASIKKFASAKKTQAKKYDKKVIAKKQVSKSKDIVLNSNLKARVDTMLEKFMDRLDSKGYSDDKKLVAIDRVMWKLEALKSKNARYAALVGYMLEKLQAYRDEIDDSFGEIESIFEDF